MSDPIPDEVCLAAANTISWAVRDPSNDMQTVIEITRAVLQSVRDHDADSIRDAVDALAKRAKEEA